MSETQNATSPISWNSTQAYTLSVICLLVGLAGGWFIRQMANHSHTYPRLRAKSVP